MRTKLISGTSGLPGTSVHETQLNRKPAQMNLGTGIAIGIAIGAAIGVGIDNLALGIGIGIAIGAALGLAFSSTGKDKPDENDRP